MFDWLKQPYVEHPIAPVDLSNSPRIRQLLRSGNIYLSLSDAIALAIENNLDIQLERYTLPSADTELLRAKGGGLLRGLTYDVFEVPVGVGGPASPLVTAAATPSVGAAGSVPTNPSELGALSEQLDNLSLLQTVPLSTGPAIPQFDPALTGQLNWTHTSHARHRSAGLRRQRSHRQHHQRQRGVHTRLRTGHGTECRVRQFPLHNQFLAERL